MSEYPAPGRLLGSQTREFMASDVAVTRALSYLRRQYPKVALLPFGSAGSGETTKMDHRTWVSDIEIGIVGGIWRRMTARRASRFLGAVLDREVDVFWIRPSRLRRGSRRNFGPAFPNLHAFNLARSEVIGDLPRGAHPIKRWEASELPKGEGLILILNRIGELLAGGGDVEYARAKVAMSCGDAILIARGSYEPTYAQRKEALVAILRENPDLLGADPGVVTTIVEAYGFKLARSSSPLPPTEPALRDAVVATLRAVADANNETLFARMRVLLGSSSIGMRVSPLRAAIRGAYAIFRGRSQVAARGAWRLFGLEPIEVQVYLALLVAYLQKSGDADSIGLFAETSSTEDSVRLWRAYCY